MQATPIICIPRPSGEPLPRHNDDANGWFQQQRRGGQDPFTDQNLCRLAAHPLKRRSRCPLQHLMMAQPSFSLGETAAQPSDSQYTQNRQACKPYNSHRRRRKPPEVQPFDRLRASMVSGCDGLSLGGALQATPFRKLFDRSGRACPIPSRRTPQ